MALAGRQAQIDQIVEHVFLARRAFELLRQARADVLQRVGDVVLGDRRSVDLGENARVGLRGAGDEPSGAEDGSKQEGEPASRRWR